MAIPRRKWRECHKYVETAKQRSLLPQAIRLIGRAHKGINREHCIRIIFVLLSNENMIYTESGEVCVYSNTVESWVDLFDSLDLDVIVITSPRFWLPR